MRNVSRLVFRPWQDSAFRVLAFSLFIAALSLSCVLLLRAELDMRFAHRTAEMLGGDIELDGSSPATQEQQSLIKPFPHSLSIRFRSVLVSGSNFLLVSVKAVDDHWPLYGQAHIADNRFGKSRPVSQGPLPGNVWMAEQGLDRLQLKVGDSIPLGQKTLRISAVIKQEPDQGAGFYSMTPRVLMNALDLPATGILAEGSRASWDLAVRAPRTTAQTAISINDLEQQLRDSLRPDQEIDTVGLRQANTLGPMRQLQLWVSLGVLLITLLCGAAMYLTTGLRVARKARLAALLRTFGASRQQILQRLLGTEFIAVCPAVVAGIGAGTGINLLLRYALGWYGALAASFYHWLAICLAPLILFAAFALPRMTALVRVPAMQVLNQHGQQNLQRRGLEATAALLAPVLLGALLLGSIRELLLLLLLLAGFGTVLPLIFWPLLRSLEHKATQWPVARRLAIRRLTRRPTTTLPLLAALSLAISILTIAGLAGSELLADWRNKLPEKAPNHFVINLFEQDRKVLEDWQQKHQAIAEPLYPIVRGRLTEINQQPVREAVTKENDRAERALNRDLSLTTANQLPTSNQLVSGEWLTGDGEVSVEEKIAEALQLELGDQLTFVTSRGELDAKVTSIRKVDWESFEPNFYFMFSDGAFQQQDITWLTGFWLPPGDGQRLAELVKQLPHITLLDVNALLDQAQEIVTQASQATATLAILLTLASLLVFSAALLSTVDQRNLDETLLRVLGARQTLLDQVRRTEFFALAVCTTTVATLLVLGSLWPIALLLLDGKVPGLHWLLLPPLLGLVVILTGLFSLPRSKPLQASLSQHS